MSANTVASIRSLINDYPDLTPVLAEQLEDNYGEVLPHLVLSDVVRWMAARVDEEPRLCQSIMGWLEREYERGSEDVRDLIAVSGVEMIPDPGQPGSALRRLLGMRLQALDPWFD